MPIFLKTGPAKHLNVLDIFGNIGCFHETARSYNFKFAPDIETLIRKRVKN